MEKNTLGIDIGSISTAMVELSPKGDIVYSSYFFHKGRVKETLAEALAETSIKDIRGIALTSSVPDIFAAGERYDSTVCIIAAAKKLHPEAGSVLIIGGEKFGLVSFDNEGSYRNYRSNSSCAAGTGSFLDQQSQRLSLNTIQEFCATAESNTGDIPRIASRCAVFAKTDLIHAQQEGYSLAEICDGLCAGLAKNVADTLFTSETPAAPMIMAGGVSRNSAVVRHLSQMTGVPIGIDELSHLYGAYGAALLHNSAEKPMLSLFSADELFAAEKKEKHYHYEPLELRLSGYPDFSSFKSYAYRPEVSGITDVETDIYIPLEKDYQVYLGIDIGSTSTKAALLDEDGSVLAGFYTRTSGRPLEAVQSIFEAIDDITRKENCVFDFRGVGTTGSGRKFIGKIIGADVMLDEITAHARAAYELDPEVDTIIEIGGQDAKFTTMKNGSVTFSIMNNVCAAGTGSFIEEQAVKLGCPLKEYSKRAEGIASPLASDRCTVFMERDLNYYLSEDYSTEEVLASVLHSVRENYLTKVAIEKNIGSKIFFQGATAKNRALVAAFEQRLGKPIMVSKFCHLTGALGAALHLIDEKITETSFRGIGLYKDKIPVNSEVCSLCNNNCKIKTAQIAGDTVAFGFLCGRDYETKKFVDENKSGFDLLKERKRLQVLSKKTKDFSFTIGIPAALHLTEELYLWKYFFNELGIKTITSEAYKNGIREGKKITGAEFCAPITEIHGHTAYLLEKADYLFLPAAFEHGHDKKIKRNYCYYTQYITSLIKSMNNIDKSKILTPVVHSLSGVNRMKKEIYRSLKKITGKISFNQVSAAYEKAAAANRVYQQRLLALYQDRKTADGINVILLGRPYTILSAAMNKGIPDIFGKEGIPVFFQDMIDKSAEEEDIQALLKAF
ncbi:MAG: acyl-CoA dehydratase activase, partial [Spirochaetia bacterium]|nr:acyl-CoA dehydratase activase [Spirochaetia bacterium]